MAGKFTVAVDNTGQLAAPFNSGAGLDFISKNGIAKTEDVNTNIATAKSEAIEAAKTETTKQVSTTKTELTTEINKKVNTTDYSNKVSSIESSISSIETTISDLNEKIDNNTASIDNLIKAFPTNNPTVSPASAKFTISDKTSLSYEVGSVINVTAKTIFTKSTYTPKYLGNQFNAEPVGTENYPFCSDAYSCTFSGGVFGSNTVVLTSTDTVNTYITEVKDFNISSFSSYTTQSYIDYNAVKVENDNLIIYNNKGEAYQTSSTGSVYANDCIIYGTLPIYGTTSNITTLTKQSTQLKHTQNTVEITLVAQTTTDNKQMILIPQEWCDTNGVSKIEQYDELFKVWNVVTTNFTSLECIWEPDGSALYLPSNNYVSGSLYPEKVLDTTKKYILLVNIGGNIGQRKLRITR